MDNVVKNAGKWGSDFAKPATTGIVWRGRRDLNPLLPSNISDLTPKPVRTLAYKF